MKTIKIKQANGCEVAIKTYEDACEALGIKPISRLLIEYGDGKKEEMIDIAHIAYVKLCTISRALNNDPEFPRFIGSEFRWYPCFYLHTQEWIDNIDEKTRKESAFWRGYAHPNAACGLEFAYSAQDWSYESSTFSSILVVKSKEIAAYFGVQFIELWRDFLIGKR